MKPDSCLFITFEGCEGCGKSTQARLLHKRLQQLHIPSLLTQEPGGTPLGNRVRNLLKVKREFNISPEAEMFLFASCRAQIVRDIINPSLKAGNIVICDRFADSTTVYQGFGRGLELKMIEKVNNIATGGLKPDMTILIDMPPERSLQRKHNIQEDRFDREDISFHHKIRNGYLELVRQEPDRWIVINGNQPIDDIHRVIWNKVSPLLANKHLLTNDG